MKKLRLKKGIIKVLVLFIMFIGFINIYKNINIVSQDELGNTCYGKIIKVCGN